MPQITVNSRKYVVEPQLTEGKFLVNSSPIEIDIQWISEKKASIIHNNKTYTVIILEKSQRNIELTLNSKKITLTQPSKADSILEKMGIVATISSKENTLKAPMPGLIVSVVVKVGDKVKKGDNLVILEAMKMENVLKATKEATVKAIKIEAKQNVEKNKILIEFE